MAMFAMPSIAVPTMMMKMGNYLESIYNVGFLPKTTNVCHPRQIRSHFEPSM
jgi:hypothetical protein